MTLGSHQRCNPYESGTPAAQLFDLLARGCRLYGWVDLDTLALNPAICWENAPEAYKQFWRDVQTCLAAATGRPIPAPGGTP